MGLTSMFRYFGRLPVLVSLAAFLTVPPSMFGENQTDSVAKGGLAAEGPEFRTWADMERFSQVLPPKKGAAPFRPTMDAAEYEEAKAAADARSPSQNPMDERGPLAPLALPMITGSDFDGIDQTGAEGTTPPDTHGAVGMNQYVQVTNFHIVVYDLAGIRLRDVSLRAFFGTTEFVFDPRVVYDSTYDRWVIVGTREALSFEDPTRIFYVAVSTGGDATGAFFIYIVNFFGGPLGGGDWWDYPQLGMDQCAGGKFNGSIIFTGNIIGPGGYRFSIAAAVPKSLLYFGLGFSVPAFIPLPSSGTIAPPIVLDMNPNTYLVAAPTSGSSIKKYTMTNTCNPEATGFTAATITVPAYSVPPAARQPGTTARLDTMDSRFVNASTQNGNSLWQVHTINSGGFARPKYYQFNTATDTVTQSGFFSASATSFDWNASIAANPADDVFVTYSSTDTGIPNSQAQVRFSGRCHGDPPGIGAGLVAVTSGTYSAQLDGMLYRWGDYSAVTLLPGDPNTAWIVNEWTPNDDQIWGSHITQIGFSPPCP